MSVSSSLLESIMKIKSYMCIPLQLKDLPVTAIFLCPKCLDIVSQIEGWIDLMRQRIFDAHEGAILYPETPLWLQALSSGAGGRAKELEVVAAVPPVAEEVVLGPAGSLSYAPEAASPPQATGAKRKPSGITVSSVPPKKIAAAAAAHDPCGVAAASPPCTSAAVRSAIDSLTTIMNVVQQGSPQKALTSSAEPALPLPPAALDVSAAAAAAVAAIMPSAERKVKSEAIRPGPAEPFLVKTEPNVCVPVQDKAAKEPPHPPPNRECPPDPESVARNAVRERRYRLARDVIARVCTLPVRRRQIGGAVLFIRDVKREASSLWRGNFEMLSYRKKTSSLRVPLQEEGRAVTSL